MSESTTSERDERPGRPIDVAALLAGCLLWGLAWWPMKGLAARGLAGPMLAIVAYGAAALCLLPAALRLRSALSGSAMLLGAIAIIGGIWNAAFMAAMVEGAASRVVLLYYVASGLSIVGGRLLFRESIDGSRRLAMVLVFGGALLVLGAPERGTLETADLLALVAGLAHAITNLAFRALERTPLVLKNFAMFVGAVAAAFIARAVASSGDAPGSPEVIGAMGSALDLGAAWPALGVIALGAAFGVGWLLFAESLTQHGVSRLPATRSAVLLIAELPFTVASASLLAGERLGLQALVGGVLIASATWIEARRPDGAAAGTPSIPASIPTSTRRAQHGLE